MKPICPMPWSTFYIKQQGELHPCCHIKEPPGVKYTIQDHGFDLYNKSDFINDLKSSLMAGKMHPEMCRDCIEQEKNHITSMREIEIEQLEKYHPNYSIDDGFVKAQFIFDNTCNLKCIMCDSLYSSKWRQEYKDIYGIDNKPSKISSRYIKEFFIKNASTLKRLEVSGGESFMGPIGLESDFLDNVIDTGKSHEIELYIETNGTIYPTDAVIEKLKKFKKIKLNISLDGVGTRNEYIRFPSVWEDHQKTLLALKSLVDSTDNFDIGIMHTLTVFNILYIKEFLDFATQLSSKPHIHLVKTPEHFSPHVMPYKLRQLVGDKLIKDKNLECMRWGKFIKETNSNNKWDKFLLYKDKHDLYRGTNFAKTFPELERLINGFQ